MNLNGVRSNCSECSINNGKKANEPVHKGAEKAKENQNHQSNTTAATYTKSDSQNDVRIYSKTNKKQDTATIEQMKAEAEQRTAQLRTLVEKMMTKQGIAYNSSTDIYELLREGKLEIDPEVAKQAEADIAEDGYWGVEKTSERLVSFARALAGDDPEKADELMEAIEEGFEQATKAWGDELPEICKKTLEATKEKMKAWKNSKQAE